MLYLLDTDHVSALQRGDSEGNILRQRLRTIAPDDYGTSIITYKEQVEGRLAEINKVSKAEVEVLSYSYLHDNLRFYFAIPLWDYTDEAAEIFALLKKQKLRVGTMDLKIATIALANDATVLTCNERDFRKIPGLRVANWTVAV